MSKFPKFLSNTKMEWNSCKDANTTIDKKAHKQVSKQANKQASKQISKQENK